MIPICDPMINDHMEPLMKERVQKVKTDLDALIEANPGISFSTLLEAIAESSLAPEDHMQRQIMGGLISSCFCA